MHPYGASREALSLARFVEARGGREVALLPMLGPLDSLSNPAAAASSSSSSSSAAASACFLGPGGGSLPPATAYVPSAHDLVARPLGPLSVSLATEARALRRLADLCAQQVRALPLGRSVVPSRACVPSPGPNPCAPQLSRHAARPPPPPPPPPALADAAAAARAVNAAALIRGEEAVCRHWLRAAEAFAPALERAATLEADGDGDAGGEGGSGGGETRQALLALRDGLAAAAALPASVEEDAVLRACSDQALGEYCREAVLPLLDRAIAKQAGVARGLRMAGRRGGDEQQGGGGRPVQRPRRLPAAGLRLVRVKTGHRIRKVAASRLYRKTSQQDT